MEDQVTRDRTAPHGSIHVVYVDTAVDGFVWTADTRTYMREGDQRRLLDGFEFLHAVRAVMEQQGYTVLAVRKPYDSGEVYVTVLDRKLPDADSVEVPSWEKVRLRCSPSTPARALEWAVCSTYAEPDVAAGWQIPGVHLARQIRSLIRQAWTDVKRRDDVVLWEPLWERFGELASSDGVLGRAAGVTLWAPERWLEPMDDCVVVKPACWKYVLPKDRHLAAKLRGDIEALREALAAHPRPSRRNAILSELADVDEVGIEWMTPALAGRPSLPDGRPRATLPAEVVAGLKEEHRLVHVPDEIHPAYEDDLLCVIGTCIPATGE